MNAMLDAIIKSTTNERWSEYAEKFVSNQRTSNPAISVDTQGALRYFN
jgi:hypothetical protein